MIFGARKRRKRRTFFCLKKKKKLILDSGKKYRSEIKNELKNMDVLVRKFLDLGMRLVKEKRGGKFCR